MTTELQGILESILFVSDTPMSMAKLCQILEEFDPSDVAASLQNLHCGYQQEGRGITLVQVSGGYQLRTRLDHGQYIRRLARIKPFKFSQSALETLAIVAYRQPIIRAEIEQLRGVDSGGVLKTLMDRKLVKILGKKDAPGRPLIYGTTRDFLTMFNLNSLSGLPTLKEITELCGTPLDENQQELPLCAVTGVDGVDTAGGATRTDEATVYVPVVDCNQ